MSVADDETKAALRQVCDRHAGAIGLGHSLPHKLVHDIFACLPDGVFGATAVAATGTNDHVVALSISPLVHRYVAYAAQYWSGLSQT